MPRRLFRTLRLAVRELGPGDVPALLAVYGDPAVARFVDDGLPIPPEDCARWVEVTERNVATRGYGMCAVEDVGTGEVVGFAGLVHPGGRSVAEVKYALRPEHWGRGLATELVRGLLRHGHERHGLRRVIATVAPENAASLRVLAKCGFVETEAREEEDGTTTLVLERTEPEAATEP